MPLTQGLTKFTTSSPIIASFTYVDIVTGTGVIVLNGYSHKEETTLGYGLTTTSPYSTEVWTKGSVLATDFTKYIDIDFDMSPFVDVRVLKGKVSVQMTIGSGSESTSAALIEKYAILKVRKWDGTTETEIASVQSETIPANTNLEIDYKTIAFETIVTGENVIAVGESLRLTVEIWAKRTSTNGSNVYLLHDPKDRIDSVSVPQDEGTAPLTSKLIFEVPFKLDL